MRILTSPKRSLRLALPLVILLAFSAPAQHSGKRPLNHKDYDSWRAIPSQALSRDGHYIAYAVFPQEGDGEVVVRDLATQKDRREPVGAAPPPPDPSPDAPPAASPRREPHLHGRQPLPHIQHVPH